MRVMRDLVGETLSSRYRLVARIAGGGMGEVYRGHDLLLDRTVAVKVLQANLAADPELVARFKAEARAARAAHTSERRRRLRLGSRGRAHLLHGHGVCVRHRSS